MKTLRCLILLFLLATILSASNAFAQTKTDSGWTQKPEIQDAQARGESEKAPEEKSAGLSAADFNKGPRPQWIWGEKDSQNYVLSTSFDVQGDVKAASLKASGDNSATVFVNGKRVASGNEWNEAMLADVARRLVSGKNTIEAKVANAGGVAAFVLKLAIQKADGSLQHIVTNTESWNVGPKRGEISAGVRPAGRGMLGDQPWGNVFANAAEYSGRVPRDVFETLPGFQVEKIFTVPRNELGSWVCLAVDDKGRLLVSDQGGKGLCRVIPAKPGSEEETIVERLDFSGCEYQPTGAQGMLHAFGSLYICCNGGPGSGLYRARDTNGDDQYDECVRLKSFRGGGEHGPHSLRLSPDGKRIFVIAGNHTDPPFQSGEDREKEEYSSRILTNWAEDLLLPRMWDANGHARGKLAPGGWIASTDPDGKTWDLWSIGYRNPYDMAFNADGELFAYDADMEWDVGSPWYRPTRVVHATPGSEFGWRSGTGKWPTYFHDSLPPLVDIGPGSPVGVDFGYGLKFPAKYQRALFICDWTFGTMYAIHIEPQASGYTATKEEFVSRSPLPLTDVVAAKDGAMYFTIGGRGTQSELYRVTYTGSEPTETVTYTTEKFAANRKARHAFEDAVVSNNNQMTSARVNDLQADRSLRYARLNFLTQKVPVSALQQTFRQSSDALSRIDHVTALARKFGGNSNPIEGSAELAASAIRALSALSFDQLAEAQKLEFLRALSLVFTRLAEPTKAQRASLVKKLDSAFPADSDALNLELCRLLVYLQSPTVIQKTADLMSQAPKRRDIQMKDLLARNPGYGRAINAMIENQPDIQQVAYALMLRNAKTKWTAEDRKAYFGWFERAQTWSGGNSFRKFLQNISNEAFLNAPENDRVVIEASGLRKPFKMAELPKPSGPGQDWSLDEVREMAADLKGRNFENGKKMFAATRCILCHRFNGDGGATGPDLTQLAGRFNVKDLTEAIMDPSKVISDQYKASVIVTEAGQTINGRVVSENESQVSVLTDPEDSTKVVDIAKDDIDVMQASKTSIMPKDLLKPLNRDEIQDLLAYLLSRGDKRNAMFRK